MRRQAAFTLIEVMVALALTGIVSLLAYGSLQAGLDTSERIERVRRESEARALMRSLVTDALRHPASAPAGGPAAFEIFNSPDGGALRFVSRGVSGPLGAGQLWVVELRSTPRGVVFDAAPLEGEATAIRGTVSALRSMRIRVLGSKADSDWQDRWESTRQVPAAVELSFLDSSRVPAGPPLVVETSLESR